MPAPLLWRARTTLISEGSTRGRCPYLTQPKMKESDLEALGQHRPLQGSVDRHRRRGFMFGYFLHPHRPGPDYLAATNVAFAARHRSPAFLSGYGSACGSAFGS